MQRKEKNYYEVLGLDPKDKANITKAQIKSAYRAKAKEVHPDKIKDASQDQEFILLHNAYETLSDESKRYSYDHPSFKYVDVNLNVNLFNSDASEADQQKKEEEKKIKAAELAQREKDLNEAYSKLHGIKAVSRKIFAALAILESSILLLAAGAVLTALACAVYLPFVAVLWFKPSLIFNDKLKYSIAEKLMLTFVGLPLVIAALPIMTLGVIYNSASKGFKEFAVRGVSRPAKVGVAILACIITAGLLVAFPPLGLAAVFGAGGSIASAMGLGGASASTFGLVFSTMVGFGAGLLGGAFCLAKDAYQYCFGGHKAEQRLIVRSSSMPDLEVQGQEDKPSSKLSSPAAMVSRLSQSEESRPAQAEIGKDNQAANIDSFGAVDKSVVNLNTEAKSEMTEPLLRSVRP